MANHLHYFQTKDPTLMYQYPLVLFYFTMTEFSLGATKKGFILLPENNHFGVKINKLSSSRCELRNKCNATPQTK